MQPKYKYLIIGEGSQGSQVHTQAAHISKGGSYTLGAYAMWTNPESEHGNGLIAWDDGSWAVFANDPQEAAKLFHQAHSGDLADKIEELIFSAETNGPPSE